MIKKILPLLIIFFSTFELRAESPRLFLYSENLKKEIPVDLSPFEINNNELVKLSKIHEKKQIKLTKN